MKEAIGTSSVFNLIMIFTGIMIALLVGSIAYSKSFKIRNRIIDIIEKTYGYNDTALIEIEENLASIGYRIVDKKCPSKPKPDMDSAELQDPQSDYRFCVYKYDSNRGDYYGVLVYMHFDIPLVGGALEIPVYGETKTMYDTGIEG